MTDKEAMKLALEAMKLNNKKWKSLADSGDAGFWKAEDQDHYKQTEDAITDLEEVLAEHAMCEVQRLGQEIEQKPVAWGVFDTQNLHDMFFTKEEAQDMARLKGDGSIVKPLYTHSPKENT